MLSITWAFTLLILRKAHYTVPDGAIAVVFALFTDALLFALLIVMLAIKW